MAGGPTSPACAGTTARPASARTTSPAAGSSSSTAGSRPRGAQLAAVASVQSTLVDSRAELAERVRLLDEQTGEGPVPRPPVWGGYRVVPETVEFWQGGADRLHDRLRFVRSAPGGDGM